MTEAARFERALLGAAVIVLVTSLGLFLFRAAPLLYFPYEVRYGEAVLLDQARRVSGEGDLYPEIGKSPYLIDNYPPVYPVLMALVPCPEGAPFFGGRLISIVATLASALSIWLIVRREAGIAAGLLAAACFLAHFDVNTFGVLARIDALALALGLGGFAALLAPGTGPRCVAVLLFFFSVYTRHSMLLFPIAASTLLFLREGRGALRWPLALIVCGILFFLAGTWWTAGGMYDHIIYYNVLPFSWKEAIGKWCQSVQWWNLPLLAALFVAFLPRDLPPGSSLMQGIGYGFILFLLLALEYKIETATITEQEHLFSRIGVPRLLQHLILACCALLALRRRRTDDEGLAIGRAGAGLLVLLGMASALQAGRDGSDVNYFLEYDAALAIAAGVAFSWGSVAKRIALAALLALGVLGHGYVLEERPTRPERLAQIANYSGEVLEKAGRVEGPILSEEPWVPVLLGRPLIYQTFMYTVLTANHRWDPAPLIEEIRSHKYAAIIRVGFSEGSVGVISATDRSFPREIRDEIKKYYEFDPARARVIDQETAVWWRQTNIWVPKK